ncbi:MAG: dienelactone hydrolase family protein [Pyrinomonadaceae bacterium]
MSNTLKRKESKEEGNAVSRRKFLERTATVGGAALISTVAANAQGDDKSVSNSRTQTALRGEMTEYKSGDLTIPAYFVRPAKKGDAPAVLVIHEVFGLNDHIKSIADRFAAAGYNALAPNFFVRASTPPPQDDKDMAAIRKAASSIPNEAAIKDMQAALDHLKTIKGVRKRFASIGFCMGGGFSYQIATHTRDLACAAIFYGRTPVELAPQVSCPIVGSFGGKDQGIPPEKVKELEEALKKAGKIADLKIYPDAGHGFFNDTRPTAYNAEAAADAWQRTLSFFRKYLKG